MLDPRIYRTGLIAVALAVIVLAFSLQNQAGPANSTLAPEAFNGTFVSTHLGRLANDYPGRSPGSISDRDLAALVAKTLRTDDFRVSDTTSSARTAGGTRTLETVTGTRAGLQTGTILIVAHRDGPGIASLSGTVTLMELANVLGGETSHRTIVLASTSGSAGAAGATLLAHQIGGPIDAVIALGDLAGSNVKGPVVIPWSNGTAVAPTALRNTLAAALSTQAGLHTRGSNLGGQFAHLAFPLTLGEQGPFGAAGDPAVTLSVTGEDGPQPGEPVSPARLVGLGRAVLQTITALDTGPAMPGPSAYLLFDGKVIPGWAIRLLVLVLILPVLAVAVDGLARANRRGHEITVWGRSLIAAAGPFVLAVLAIVAAKALGVLHATPPGPTGPGVVPIPGAGIALIAVLALAVVAILLLLRRTVRGTGEQAGGAVSLVIVMCVVALLIWLVNPFAAALAVPALHLWVWLLDPELRVRRGLKPVLLIVGLVPPLLVALYYALSLGYSPTELVWSGLLMLAGGHIGVTAAIEWALMLGCAISISVAALTATRTTVEREEQPVTVRGPVTYAGPGSLGGTDSALRARR